MWEGHTPSLPTEITREVSEIKAETGQKQSNLLTLC